MWQHHTSGNELNITPAFHPLIIVECARTSSAFTKSASVIPVRVEPDSSLEETERSQL